MEDTARSTVLELPVPAAPVINYFVHRRCTPTWGLTPALTTDCDITYCVEGAAQYRINGDWVSMEPGSLLCLPPGVLKEARVIPSRLMRCYAVNFTAGGEAGGHAGDPPPALPLLSAVGVQDDLVRLYRELNYVWLEKPPAWQYRASGQLLIILARLLDLTVYGGGPAMDARIKKATRYIAQRYNKGVSARRLAELTGLSGPYFGALFKRETGCSLSRYVARTRALNAKNMLETGEYRVSEVADLCGYCDIYHFDKQFHALMGAPPSAFIPRGRR